MIQTRSLPLHALRALVIAAALGATTTGAARPANAEPEATTWYVSPAGNDGNPCNASAAPCQSLQAAINKAASGDTILIAEGTYTFTIDQCGSNVNAVACIAEKNLTLRGGYDPASWSGPNLAANPTIIDGGNQRRGLAVLGAGIKPAVTVESVIVQNGRGGPFGTTAPDAFGGGMLVNFATAIVRNVEFRNNRSVGDNTGGGRGGKGSGGGIAILSSPGQNVIQSVLFEGNQAVGGSGPERGGEGSGGALFTFQSQANVSNATVTNNTAQGGNSAGNGTSGDAMESDGLGGGFAFQVGSVATVQSSTFTGNVARGGNAGQNGGNAFGGAVFGELSTMTLTNCNIRQNLADAGDGAAVGGLGGGGAIAHNSSAMTVERTFMIDNSSLGGDGATAGPAGGGALYIARFFNDAPGGGVNTVTNSIIAANSTRQGGGNSAGGGGGGIWAQGLPLNLTHVTLAGNSTGSGMLGSAMIVNNFGTPQAATVNLAYSIVSNHSDVAIEVFSGNTLNLNRGLWAANGTNTGGGGAVNGAGSMLSAGSAGYASPGAPNFDYRLAAGSAAIDQATGSTTAVDIEGQSRPRGSANDIGADEFYPPLVNGRPWAYLPIAFR